MTFLELEKRCKKRRIYKIIKWLLFVCLLTAAVFLAVFYFIGNSVSKNSKHVKKEPVKHTVGKKEKKIKKTKTHKQHELKYIIDLNITQPEHTKPEKTVKKHPAKQNVVKKPLNLKKEQNRTLKTEKKVSLIQTTALPSYNTCISMAKSYYNQGNYKDALKWAKNANIQNNKNPESWILSAKSLYKLGKKKEALKVLRIYNEYKHDKNIEQLIRKFSENN